MDLFPNIVNAYPYWTRPCEELNFYYRQCFVVLEYLPSIRRQVFEFVIDRSLEMDVNIKIQDGGHVMIDDEEADEAGETGVFEMDGFEEAESTQDLKKKEDSSVDEISDKV